MTKEPILHRGFVATVLLGSLPFGTHRGFSCLIALPSGTHQGCKTVIIFTCLCAPGFGLALPWGTRRSFLHAGDQVLEASCIRFFT